MVRGRMLVRIAGSLDESAERNGSYDLAAKLPLQGHPAIGLQPVRDLDQVRSFLSTVGPAALFDLPWMPLYLGICFAFHPLIGLAATVGAPSC